MYLKAYSLVIVLGFITIVGNAQVKTLGDTLSTIDPTLFQSLGSNKSHGNTSDSIYRYDILTTAHQYTLSNITQLVSDTTNRISLLQLDYTNAKSSFRPPTEPYLSQTARFYTEGTASFKKVKLLGKFYFDKVWEDSLPNNLSGDLQNGDPFNYFAIKAGKFERQNFKIVAGAGYEFIKRLYLGAMINYDYSWSTGSVDPRPENKIFRVRITPSLTYQFNKTFIGANYIIGKTDESIDITYKNSMFAQSQLYPDRRLYLNTGYGYITQLTSNSPFSNIRFDHSGIGLSLSTTVSGWKVAADYDNIFSVGKYFNQLVVNNGNIDSSRIVENTYGRYEITTQQLNVLINKSTHQLVHQIGIQGLIKEGTAQMTSLPSGASYLYDEHHIGFQYKMGILANKKIKNEVGVEAALDHFDKKDFLAFHFYENTRARWGASYTHYLAIEENMLKLKLSPLIVTPIKNALSVPITQVNAFTRNTVYGEYDFYGSGYLDANLNISYFSRKLIRFASSGIFANIRLARQLKSSDINMEDYPLKANNAGRIAFNLGFQVFL